MRKVVSLYIYISILLISIVNQVSASNVQTSALVNNELITSLDLEKYIKIIKTLDKKQQSFSEKELHDIALNQMINESLFRQEAEKLKLKVSPEELDNVSKNLLKSMNFNGSSLREYTKSHDIDYNTLLNSLKSKLLWDKIVLAKVVPFINVTQEEIINFQNKLNSTRPYILITTQEVVIHKKNISDDIIKDIKKKLADSISVDELNKQYQSISTAYSTINFESINKDIAHFFKDVKVGDILGPIAIDGGSLIVKILNYATLDYSLLERGIKLKQIKLTSTDLIKEFKKTTCENIDKLTKELGLSPPLTLEAKVRELNPSIQILLPKAKINEVITSTQDNKVIVLCDINKQNEENYHELIRKKLFEEKLLLQMQFLLGNMRKNAVIETRL